MSNGLLFLVSDDFSVKKAPKGFVLCNNIKGFSLVLFYSNQCVHCKDLVPTFKKLVGIICGCQIALANVSQNKNTVEMSKGTVEPITYVPYIVMYLNGVPLMVYNEGDYHEEKLKQFIFYVAQDVQKKQQFATVGGGNNGALTGNSRGEMQGQDQKSNTDTEIGKYCIGVPLIGSSKDQVCYLEDGKAYQKNLSS